MHRLMEFFGPDYINICACVSGVLYVLSVCVVLVCCTRVFPCNDSPLKGKCDESYRRKAETSETRETVRLRKMCGQMCRCEESVRFWTKPNCRKQNRTKTETQDSVTDDASKPNTDEHTR